MDFLIKNLIFDIQRLKEKVKILEENSHPQRDFVECERCKKQVKEKKNG